MNRNLPESTTLSSAGHSEALLVSGPGKMGTMVMTWVSRSNSRTSYIQFLFTKTVTDGSRTDPTHSQPRGVLAFTAAV